MTWEIRQGRNLELLAEIPDESVQTCITSPPYWGLRDYGEDEQLGLESTPEEYVQNMVAVFREVRRVLRNDGTLWLNLGDSYAGSWGAQSRGGPPSDKSTLSGNGHNGGGPKFAGLSTTQIQAHPKRTKTGSWVNDHDSLKPKDLVGIPWRVAFALQADGWYLRSDIIWHKPNPMPESVTDRPTKAHEYIFLLTKQPRYYYDAEAIREAGSDNSHGGGQAGSHRYYAQAGRNDSASFAIAQPAGEQGRNRRSVWTVTTKPFSGAHFAVFPPDLIEPCVLAGASPTACGECGAPYERIVERVIPTDPGRGESKLRDADGLSARAASTAKRQLGGNYQKQLDANPPTTVGWKPTCDHSDDSGKSVVLDPFSGSGTTGMVALRHGRSYIGLELNPEYAEMSRNRIRDDAPLLNTGLEAAA